MQPALLPQERQSALPFPVVHNLVRKGPTQVKELSNAVVSAPMREDLYTGSSVSQYKSKAPLKTAIFAECVDGKIDHSPILDSLSSIHPVLGKSEKYAFPRNMGLEPERMMEEIKREHQTLTPRFTIIAPHTNCAGDPNTPVGAKMKDLVARVSTFIQKRAEPHMILGGKIWGGHKKFALKRVIVSDLAPLKLSQTPENQEHLKMYETALENIRKRFNGVKIQMLDAQGNVISSEKTPRKLESVFKHTRLFFLGTEGVKDFIKKHPANLKDALKP